MTTGFSYDLVRRVESALESDPSNPVFLLIHRCIKKNIPISQAASKVGISRAAMYAYMDGLYKPKKDVLNKIESLYKSLAKK